MKMNFFRFIKLKILLPLFAFITICSCEGSMGCSGCSGCGVEMQPIPGDFPLDRRIKNGAQLHIGQKTFDFLENNYNSIIQMLLPDGLSFEIPPSSQDVNLIGTVDICPHGGCTANARIINMTILPVPPSTIRSVLQVEVEIYDLPVIIHQGIACLCWDTCDCLVDFSTTRSGRPYNSLLIDVVMEKDTITDYTSIKIQNSRVVDDIENDDLHITNSNFCGIAVCNIANLDFIKSIITDELQNSLSDQLNNTNDQFCRSCKDGCPPGSSCDNPDLNSGKCKYPDGTCVPVILGVMGRMDIGTLLKSISPGMQAAVDFLFAAGGYAQTRDNPESADLGFYTGAEAAPVNPAVRKSPIPCETESDCPSGYTCSPDANLPAWILPCRRCGSGCPEGSSPRDNISCIPDPENPDSPFDPSQPCILDDDSCIPIKYCIDPEGKLAQTMPPGEEVVPVAESLKTETFTHCKFCESDEQCNPPYTCDMYGICTDREGNCQNVTEDAMIVAGISRSALKRMVYGAISSGALNVEIPPGMIPQLTSGTLTLAIRALENIIWDDVPVAITLKPAIANFNVEKPELDAMDSPDVLISDSPILSIILRDITIDFYGWIEDTYSRFLSATFDLSLNLDLDVRGGVITPIIKNPEVNDVRVYNKDLLTTNTEDLRNIIGGVVELAMGFIPPIEPVEIPPIDPIVLNIPDGGVTHIKDSGEDFLVLFATLSISETPPPPPYPAFIPPVETSVELIEKFNPAVNEIDGTAPMFRSCDKQPYFKVKFSAFSPATVNKPFEYRWRLNRGPWSRWSKKETEIIQSRQFVFQGKHLLEAQARISGLNDTVDTEPAKLQLLVDGMPPRINIETKTQKEVKFSLYDMVTPPSMIQVKVEKTFVDGVKSNESLHNHDGKIKINADRLKNIKISATDEAGNSSSVIMAIRGRLPQPSPETGGCGIITGNPPENKEKGVPFIISILLTLISVTIFLKKNNKKTTKILVLLILFFVENLLSCSCEKGDKGACGGKPGPECCLSDEDCGNAAVCCPINNKCIPVPPALQSPPAPSSLEGWFNEGCEPGFFCQDMPAFVIGETAEEGCSFDWSCCEEASPLQQGRLATYLGMDVQQNGDETLIWLSGYNPGVTKHQRYGDLVAGKWDIVQSQIQWEILDGVPENGFVSNSTSGWRKGISDPGDDVGLYTSLVINSSAHPMISYYDKTHGSLKFIEKGQSEWLPPETIDDGTKGFDFQVQAGNAGLFSEMILSSSQTPTIFYRAVTYEARNHPGASGYQVVHISTHLKAATRNQSGGWDVAVLMSMEDTPCWSGSCPEGYVCRVQDRLCWPPDNSNQHQNECSSCSSSQACLSKLDSSGAATNTFGCEDILVAPVDIPEGTGIWTSAALNGDNLEIVTYERTGGNLIWIAQTNGVWQEPVILDGDENSPDPSFHGDRGWYPSLAIDNEGNRHIVYVDGLAETLEYMMVDSSNMIALKETIDDGINLINEEKDLVGDNTSISIDSSGRLRVVYQNSSNGFLVMAIKTEAGTWEKHLITDPDSGFSGYYAVQKIINENSYIAYFFFNYESPPMGEGVNVLTCTINQENIPVCN